MEIKEYTCDIHCDDIDKDQKACEDMSDVAEYCYQCIFCKEVIQGIEE